jgi:hypothetical protein
MSGELRVRVHVLDVWDEIKLDLPPVTSIGALKQEALDLARVTEDPEKFLVKFRGAEMRDESRTLADEQVPADAALIVMRRRRVPVR